jgi:hypothetical protein
MTRLLPIFALFALTTLAAACSPSNPPPDASVAPECRELSSACHSYDDGDAGVAHECHELGHDTNATAAMCVARRAECLAACPPRDGGADSATDH